MRHTLLHLHPEHGTIEALPFDLGTRAEPTTVALRGIDGGTAVQAVVCRDGSPVLRVEIPLDETELVRLRLWAEADLVRWSVRGRRALQLPTDPPFAPPRPLVRRATAKKIDLVLLIDLTTRVPVQVDTSKEKSTRMGLLIGQADAWARHVEELLDLVGQLLPEQVDLRASVIGFGDTTPARASAKDLKPDTPVLVPEDARERELKSVDLDRLRHSLLRLRPTTGADFVDALCHGLEAVRALRWREEARHLLVIVGDSPGYSLMRPGPPGADVQVRELDVDAERAALIVAHDVEILTIYHDLPLGSDLRDLAQVPPLVAHAESQYRRLASMSAWALLASTFDPGEVARSVRDSPPLLAHGVSLPVLADGNS